MTTKNPLALVKEQFGDKAKLVAAVEKFTGDDLWVARTNKDKGLAHVSNAKLLRLHVTFTEVKAKFGTRDKLIDAILEQQKRTKDAGLRQRLSLWPVPRLYDAYKSAAKRAAGAAKAAPAAAAKKKGEAAPKAAAAKKSAAAAKPASADADAKKTAAKKASA
jgi:hypothetical protein